MRRVRARPVQLEAQPRPARLFTAANLLPQQALLIPLFRLFTEVPLPEFMSDSELLYDSYWGLILINVAFQTGFCVFVLSNYMKALPRS